MAENGHRRNTWPRREDAPIAPAALESQSRAWIRRIRARGALRNARSPFIPRPPVDQATPCGEVPEWSIGTVSKTVVLARVPWVRIPPSPPFPFRYLSRMAAPARACGSWPPMGSDSTPLQPGMRNARPAAVAALAAEAISPRRISLIARPSAQAGPGPAQGNHAAGPSQPDTGCGAHARYRAAHSRPRAASVRNVAAGARRWPAPPGA